MRFTNAQHQETEELKERWHQLYVALKLVDPEHKGYLRVLQEFIAKTRPEERCPCKDGRLLIFQADRHFPECPHATLHVHMREHTERWVARRDHHRRLNARQLWETQMFRSLSRSWVLNRVPRDELRRLKRLMDRQRP